MPSTSIHDCLKPSFFVSYSRRQGREAEELKSILVTYGRSVWFDRDKILVGDDWRSEIRAGIVNADELVLLLSDASLASEVVAEEVQIALEHDKLVRPVVVESLSGPLPDHLSRIHYLDLTTSPSLEARRAVLQRFFGEAGVATPAGAADIKVAACRGVWPAFDETSVDSAGRARAGEIATGLDRLRGAYPAASGVWLNAGLQHCIAGQWDRGLEALRVHARAANTLAGWYFLALHLPRGGLVLRMAPGEVDEAVDAVHRALRLAANPLALLLAAVLETGGANAGAANLSRRMDAFAEALAQTQERASEFVRAYWCLKPSLRVLGGYEEPIKSFIRGMRA